MARPIPEYHGMPERIADQRMIAAIEPKSRKTEAAGEQRRRNARAKDNTERPGVKGERRAAARKGTKTKYRNPLANKAGKKTQSKSKATRRGTKKR
jgi:hypothetical protein